MTDYSIDYDYIISVPEVMMLAYLPEPRKRNVIVNYGEVLPIISIEV